MNKKYIKFSELPVKNSVLDNEAIVMANRENNIIPVKVIREHVMSDAKSQFVPKTRTINGKSLETDVVLDVATSGHTHPLATLTDPGFMSANDRKELDVLPLELADKATKEDFNTLLDAMQNLGDGFSSFGPDVENISDLDNVVNPQVGMGVKVTNDVDKYGNSYIWRYNGTTWDRTPFTSVHGKAITEEDLKKYVGKTTFFNISQEFNKYNFDSPELAKSATPLAYRKNGTVVAYSIKSQGWSIEQFVNNDPSMWLDSASWAPIGGGGGLLNLTNINDKVYSDPSEARSDVDARYRMSGQLITYLLSDGGWILDMFIGDSIVSWNDDAMWRKYATQSDIEHLELAVKDVEATVETLSETIDEKGDALGLEDLDEDNVTLSLLSNGLVVSEVTLPKGGGGSGTSGIVMKLRAIGGTTIVAGEDTDAFIKWDFSSIDSDDNSETGDGTVVISIDNVSVYTSSIPQGAGQFNVKNYIALGRNAIKLTVTDSYGNVRSIRYTIQKASLKLSSVFSISELYTTKPVAFRYMVTGAGEKTVQFWLNGVELDPEKTTTSGVQLTKQLHTVVADVNTLRVKATSVVEGVTIDSNELYYEFIYAESGVGTQMIISSFNETSVKQFSTISIPFFAYDPFNERANVSVFINDLLVESLDVPRASQIWEHRVVETGTLKIKLQCGSAAKEFILAVIPSDEGISEVTGDLTFRVKALGKSNASSSRDNWEHNGYSTLFRGFNWVDNGWLRDKKGNSALKFTGNANVGINIRPFSNTVLTRGLTYTIEYSTENVADDEAVIMEQFIDGVGIKITPTSISVNSVETGIKSYLDSSEKISISFVIEKKTDSRLLEIYINGILSRSIRYSETDRFNQSDTNLKVSTANNNAVVYLYTVRWYQNNLVDSQILSNFIYDTENSTQQSLIFNRNNIINEYGNIDYNKVLNYISCMKIIGELPMAKGQKKIVDISFTNLQGESKSFYAKNVEIDVQGTSSQFYPRKNYKFKFKYKVNGVVTEALVTLSDTGEVVKEYTLSENTLPANVFCTKADFAESSGVHNTGLAVIVNEILKTSNIKPPEQIANDKISTTIYGYPCLIFHQESNVSEPVFIGKYNFNYDKSAEHTFGFHEGCESWEFKDNTSDMCLFKAADFDSTYVNDKGQTVPVWTNHLEGRYPDESTNVSNVRKVFDWVISCKGNVSKFKSEAPTWFNIDNLLSYWVLTEHYAAIDQRAKNQFLTMYEDKKWRLIFYDNDTILGIDNIGTIKFRYDVETEDIVDSGHVFNGWDSELWKLVKEAFWVEITNMYTRLRSGKMTYDYSMGIFQDMFSNRWAERIYNKDGYFKYIEPLLTENKDYLAELQGSRTTHRIWWLKNRFQYMDSRFKTGDYRNDFVSLRLYTPTSWGGVSPNADFRLTTNKPGYIHVRFGQTDSDQFRTVPNTPFTITAPTGMQFNDTETILYGASALKDLGDMSNKYLGLVDITSASRLEKLIIGSTVTNYSNTNFKNLSLGNNSLLREINIANCPNFGNIEAGSVSSSLNLSKLLVLEKINASNTSLKSINFAETGTIKEMRLPSTITTLLLKNQTGLTHFSITGYKDIQSLHVENTPFVDGYTIAKNIIRANPSRPALKVVRLTDVNINDVDASTLLTMSNIEGIDDAGTIVPRGVVTGTAYIASISESVLDALTIAFPKLSINYGQIVDVIEFEDPKVKAILVPIYDTNGDGELSRFEVEGKTIAKDLFIDSGITKFNELQYFNGVGSIINNVPTLTELSMVAGRVSLDTLQELKKVTIIDKGEILGERPGINFGNSPSIFKNVTSITDFVLSGRYVSSAGNTGIYAKCIDAGGIRYNELVMPMLGIQDLYLNGNVSAASFTGGFQWWKDVRRLTIEKLHSLSIYGTGSLSEVKINGIIPNHKAHIQLVTHELNKIEIGSFIGDGEFSGITCESWPAVNGTTDLIISDEVRCDYAVGSGIIFNFGNVQRRHLRNVTLGKNFKPKVVQFSSSSLPPSGVTVIKSNTFISALVTNNAYPATTMYVEDALVDEYNADANWRRYVGGGRILPLSSY